MHTLKPRVKEGLSTHGAFAGVLQHFLYLGIVTNCTLYKRSPEQENESGIKIHVRVLKTKII